MRGDAGAVFTRDDSRIISWSADGTVRVWDTLTGKEMRPIMRHDNAISGVLMSQNEERLLSWSSDNTVRLWNVAIARQVGLKMKPSSGKRVGDFGPFLNCCLLLLLSLWVCGQRACVVHHVHSDDAFQAVYL